MAASPGSGLSDALSRLGDVLRAEAGAGRPGPVTAMASGQAVPRQQADEALGQIAVDDLVTERLLVPDGPEVRLATRLWLVGQVVTVAPDPPGTTDMVYLGPDSALLAEAALRLAPSGERAADLGTGTGFLAAVLARRYRTVIAADISPRAVAAASLTLALNPSPAGHASGAAVADVADGLRPGAFDLVTANTPWVPSPPDSTRPLRIFADGGPTGVELPTRFLRCGVRLLRPGGLAITLALDVTLSDDYRPLARVCTELEAAGHTAIMVPTPINQSNPEMESSLRAALPLITRAEHVAVIVGRAQRPGVRRDAIAVAAQALGRRWADRATILDPPPGSKALATMTPPGVPLGE